MPTPNLSWWQRIAQAIGLAMQQPAPPALPPDAQRELEMWDAETVARYRAEHGGEAPPGAPEIDEGGI